MTAADLLCLIVVALMCTCVKAMWIHPEQNGSAPVHIPTPRLRYLDPPAPAGYWDSVVLEGEWVYVKDHKTNVNLTEKVVFYDQKAGEGKEKAIQLFKGRGILALVTLSRTYTDYPGSGNWIRDGTKPKDHDFPVFEFSLRQNKSMGGWYNNQSKIMVSLEFDRNPWDPIYAIAIPIVSLPYLVFSGIILVIAVWKQLCIILDNGFQISMAQSVLWMNIVGCIIRVILFSADPFGASETTNFLFQQILLSLSFPFAIGGALLISLYWHEMIVKAGNRKINLFLDKMRTPFFCWCLFMFLFELTTSTLRGLFYSFNVLVFIDGAIYFGVSLAVVTFFIITRYRLQAVFNRINKGLKSRREERLTLATFHLQVMIAMMCSWIIFLVILGATNLIWIPIGFPIIWATFFFSFHLVCLFQVIIIKAPYRSPRSVFMSLFYDTPVDTIPTSPRSFGSSSNEKASSSSV